MRSHRPRLYSLALLPAVAVVILTGCGSATISLWTDQPEVAPVVEVFNASQDRFVVELHYEPDISRALRVSDSAPDVVVAASIEDQATAGLFRSLDRLMADGIDPEEFYEPLLVTGQRNGRQLLLPLSFNLPVVFFVGNAVSSDGEITISPEQMRTAGLQFNEFGEERAVRLAFSPLWDGAFLYELVRFEGFIVTESEIGAPQWELSSLLTGVNTATAWLQEDGGVETDNVFREQYLYDPAIRLVQGGRILFGYETSSHYFKRSDESRQDLTFSWFGTPGQVPVLESVVYAGMPDRAENRGGAETFLTWLFDVDVQEQVLENNRRKRIDSFGVVDGFSSLWRVTERAIPAQYPALMSRIPPAAWLRFSGPRPRHWSSVVQLVVEPWLLREVAGQPQSRDLASSVEAWLLQQEE